MSDNNGAEVPSPLTAQDHNAAGLAAVSTRVEAWSQHPRAVLFTPEDSLAFVKPFFEDGIGRPFGLGAIWVRFYRADQSAGLLVGLQNPVPPGEMDLVVVGSPGMLNRTVLRFVSEWVFIRLGLTRLVARISVGSVALADILRRAGFKHEGIARGFYPDGDASVWAMTRDDCPWLPRQPLAISAGDLCSVPSQRWH